MAARVAHALLTLESPTAEITRILGGGSEARAVADLISLDIPASGAGPASNAQAIENLILKGFYAVNATKRISESENRESAIRNEARYHAMHTEAIAKRDTAASIVDEASTRFGPTLSWRAVMDDSTTSECREAHGSNFQADVRPPIGWPGSVHPRCRCSVGPAIQGAGSI